MKYINIKIDNELLTSSIIDEDKKTRLNSKQTLELLKNITLNESKFIKLENETLTFFNDGYSFIIDNANEIRNINSNVDRIYTYATFDKKRIEQKEKHKNKPLFNKKINSKKVLLSTAILTSSLLFSNSNNNRFSSSENNDNLLINNSVKNEKVFDFNDEDLDTIIKELDEIASMNKNELNDLNILDNNINEIYLNYETIDEDKMNIVNNVRTKYGNIIDEYSTKWGLDSRLVTAILSQESGGRETNIGQIEFDIVKNELITVYNFNELKYQTFMFSDEVGNDPNVIYITRENLDNEITNISCTCILLRHNLDMLNNHLMASLTAYNQGYGTVTRLIDNEVIVNNLNERNDVLNNQSDISFIDTLANTETNNGDELYASNVMRYLTNPDEPLELKIINDNKEVETIDIRINSTYNINKHL